MRRTLARALRFSTRLVDWAQDELEAIVRQAFRVVAVVATLALLVALISSLSAQPPDAKAIGTIFACLLAAAFVAAYGEDIASRIKKIGPVELLDIQKTVLSLEAMGTEVIRNLDDGKSFEAGLLPLRRVDLSPAQEFHYKEGCRILGFLELSANEPKEGAQVRVFFDLLFYVGRTAHGQLDLLLAIYFWQRLEKLSAGSHRAIEVSLMVAFSEIFYALQPENVLARESNLEDAVVRLDKLAREGRLSDLGYFWLAYAQDELKSYYEAVQSSLEVLKRRPRLGQARYNMAISLLKLGRNEEAYRCLSEIGPSAEKFEILRKNARRDLEMPRLLDLITDPRQQRRLRAAWRKLTGEG